jgi:hypothetical protein
MFLNFCVIDKKVGHSLKGECRFTALLLLRRYHNLSSGLVEEVSNLGFGFVDIQLFFFVHSNHSERVPINFD